jgi:hypothetical protein
VLTIRYSIVKERSIIIRGKKHIHPHLSSGAGTIGQKWPQYKELSPTPLAITIIIIIIIIIIPLIPDNMNLSLQRIIGRSGLKLNTCVNF